MEASKWPEFKLLEPLEKLKTVARFIGRLITPSPHDAPDYVSDHYRLPDAEGEALEPDLRAQDE